MATEACAWCGSPDQVSTVRYREGGDSKEEPLCATCKATGLERRRARRSRKRKATPTTRAMRAAGVAFVAVSVIVFLLGVAAAYQSFFG